jgi:catechol 2,3-dioxygenase-like lactoylglutathione lyase family enzyme
MSRVQLALNVTDLGAAVEFYRKVFGAEPSKVRPDYANFAIDDPPLKLILFAGKESGGTLNHLGVEVGSPEDVAAHATRLTRQGLATASESGACCYAVQEKVWVRDPDGAPWEFYTVLGDAPAMSCAEGSSCC